MNQDDESTIFMWSKQFPNSHVLVWGNVTHDDAFKRPEEFFENQLFGYCTPCPKEEATLFPVSFYEGWYFKECPPPLSEKVDFSQKWCQLLGIEPGELNATTPSPQEPPK